MVRPSIGTEYWNIADVHVATFYPEAYRGVLGGLLQLDRVAALHTGYGLARRPETGRFVCLVAEDRAQPSSSPAARPLPPWANLLPMPLKALVGGGGSSSHQGPALMGAVVVDTFCVHVPERKRDENGVTRHYKRRGVGYISNLCVAPDSRRQGIGRALLDKCEQQARAWGCRSIALHVDLNNTSAYELYRRAGYKVAATEPPWVRYVEGRPGSRLVLMMRTLRTMPVLSEQELYPALFEQRDAGSGNGQASSGPGCQPGLATSRQ